MKITKAIRDGAILVASVYASSGGITNDAEMAATLGVPPESNELSWAAWNAALRMNAYRDALDPALDGEVECLLREGWSPGDLLWLEAPRAL